jgi:hypothetical protein
MPFTARGASFAMGGLYSNIESLALLARILYLFRANL